jgi:hypothetical protein
MPDRDDPNSPHATTPNINGRVARLEIDVATLRSGQDFSTRLLDERFKTFEAQMVGHQKSLDAIQALIETSRVNPEGSPIVRQYLEWRATVETRLTEFQDPSRPPGRRRHRAQVPRHRRPADRPRDPRRPRRPHRHDAGSGRLTRPT